MRRRITYANVAATLALVFSMSGGALAASHYLINSTKQINPKVLKKLKGTIGKAGAPGTPGKEGATGKEGAAGKEGKEGKAVKSTGPTTLGSGETETGAWSADDTEAPAYATISFAYPTSKAPTVHLIPPGSPAPSGCSGTVENPGASSGNLCIFAEFLYNSSYGGVFNPGNEAQEAGIHGAVVYLEKIGAGHFDGAGTWAVTG